MKLSTHFSCLHIATFFQDLNHEHTFYEMIPGMFLPCMIYTCWMLFSPLFSPCPALSKAPLISSPETYIKHLNILTNVFSFEATDPKLLQVSCFIFSIVNLFRLKASLDRRLWSFCEVCCFG